MWERRKSREGTWSREGINQQCWYCPEKNNMKSEGGTSYLFDLFSQKWDGYWREGKSKGNFKWIILKHLCAVGNNSEEQEYIGTQKKGRIEGNCWRRWDKPEKKGKGDWEYQSPFILTQRRLRAQESSRDISELPFNGSYHRRRSFGEAWLEQFCRKNVKLPHGN